MADPVVTDAPEGGAHDDAPQDQSPLEDALAGLADADFGGDDDDPGYEGPPADDDGADPGFNPPTQDEDEDGDELELEDEQGDEGEGDDDLEEGEALIAVPESLREQGYEDFVVPEEQKELFQSLTSSYESRQTREAEQARIEQYEQDLMADAEEFRVVAATNPLEIINATFGNDAEAAHDVATMYLLQDPDLWKAHVERVAKLNDPEEFAMAKRELEANHRERVQGAEQRIRAREAGRAHAAKVTERIESVLSQVNEADREFVKARLIADVRAKMSEESARSGTDLIDISVVDAVAKPWLGRFGDSQPAPKSAEEESASDAAKVREAQSRIRAKAEKRARARRVAPSGGRTGGPNRPKKGQTLDEVMAELKAGKL